MSKIFEYQEVTRKPNPMKKLNPLARVSSKRVTLADRLATLQDDIKWQRTIKNHRNQNRVFKLSSIPSIARVRLGDVIIDEDIQRGLDAKHCANKIGGEDFRECYMQPLYCMLNSVGEYISIDAQHTATTLCGLIDAGLFLDDNGNTVSDWRDVEYPCTYVETDDASFARKAFGLVNGKGKLRQSKYNELRNAVYCIRIDGNTSDEKDVEWEKKVQIAEKNDCYPVEDSSGLAKYPGTFTHILLFLLASDDALKMGFSWHNKYFHYETIHACLFPIFRDITRDFKAAKIKVSAKLLKDIAGMIQTLFGDLEQFGKAAMRAQREWSKARYGYEQNWQDDQYAAVLFQLYKKMGGTEQVPLPLLDKYSDPRNDTNIADFLDQEILDMAV